MGSSNPESGSAGFNYDDETMWGEPTPTPEPSEIVTAEEQLLSEGVPQRSDYETISDYEDAVEGFDMRLEEAKGLDKELSYDRSDETSGFKMPSKEKLKKFSEKTKGLGQNNQQVVRGSGPAGYGGPSARSSYVPAQSPYQITRRGPSTGELEKMLLEGLKTSANMRISGFQGPRIRGLFG